MLRPKQLFLLLAFVSIVPLPADDGDLDLSFSGDGIVASSGGTGWRVARAAHVFDDGSFVAGGSDGTAGNTTDFYVTRYGADGSIDGLWGNLGSRKIEISAGEDDVETIVPDGDGLLLLGTTPASGGAKLPASVRLTAEGDLDPAFGDAGIAIAAAPAWGGANHIYGAIRFGAGALFLGNCTTCIGGGIHGFSLYRTLADGDPDPGFGTQGWFAVSSGFNAGVNAWALAATADGKIVFATTRRPVGVNEIWIHRRLASGAPDTTFGDGDGLVTFVAPNTQWTPSALAIDPVDSAIYIGLREGLEESSIGSGSMARVTGTGVHDTEFGFPDLSFDEDSTIEDLVLSSDRKLFAVGRIDGPDEQPGGFFVARLLRTGELDDSFDANGVKRVEIDAVPDGYDGGLGIALSGGRPLLVGFHETDGPGTRMAIVRLTNSLIFADGFERGSTASW